MKIKRFNPENSRKRSNGIASITVTKSGVISFSNTARIKLGLEDGIKIEFIQPEEHPKDWFIIKTPTGFKLRNNSKRTGLMFNSSTIAREIFKSVGFKGRTARFLVSTEQSIIDDDYVCYAIITSSIKTLKE